MKLNCFVAGQSGSWLNKGPSLLSGDQVHPTERFSYKNGSRRYQRAFFREHGAAFKAIAAMGMGMEMGTAVGIGDYANNRMDFIFDSSVVFRNDDRCGTD